VASWRTSFKPHDWYCVRVSKCASPHNSDILSLGQVCSTSACRQNTTRHFPHQHFRLVLQIGVKDNVKFKVTPVIPVAPCLPVFQWSSHQQSMKRQPERTGLRCGYRRMYWPLISGHKNNCSIELRKFNPLLCYCFDSLLTINPLTLELDIYSLKQHLCAM